MTGRKKGEEKNKAIYFFSKLASGRNPPNLIGSESGRYFTILPANPGGIRWQLHSQVCLSFVNEQKSSFSTHFSFKTCAIISIS